MYFGTRIYCLPENLWGLVFTDDNTWARKMIRRPRITEWKSDLSPSEGQWIFLMLASKYIDSIITTEDHSLQGNQLSGKLWIISQIVYRRPIVNLWHKDTSWGKYAMSQGEVSPDWLIYTSWCIIYASWGMNWPISVYLTLRHGIFASWGILMPQVNNGPTIKNDSIILS